MLHFLCPSTFCDYKAWKHLLKIVFKKPLKSPYKKSEALCSGVFLNLEGRKIGFSAKSLKKIISKKYTRG